MAFFTHLKWILLVFCAVVLWGCNSNSSQREADSAYVAEIQQWHQKRLASLKSKTGWLSLAGLYWLEEGENTFGADSSNKIVFPPGKAADFMGAFILKNGEVDIHVRMGIEIYHEDKLIEKMRLFGDKVSDPITLTYGPLSWFIIKRGTQIGIRLRDAENPAISELKSIESYSIDPQWKAEARLERYDPPKQVPVQNILGMTTEELSPGMLVFELRGSAYKLEAIDSGDDLFIMFTDETSGKETYGSGRYMYVKKPPEGAATIIDFNKAYNPPCAYTDYATCSLPSLQNHIAIEVTAGEKYHGMMH